MISDRFENFGNFLRLVNRSSHLRDLLRDLGVFKQAFLFIDTHKVLLLLRFHRAASYLGGLKDGCDLTYQVKEYNPNSTSASWQPRAKSIGQDKPRQSIWEC